LDLPLYFNTMRLIWWVCIKSEIGALLLPCCQNLTQASPDWPGNAVRHRGSGKREKLSGLGKANLYQVLS
jgi:hypothetical protein